MAVNLMHGTIAEINGYLIDIIFDVNHVQMLSKYNELVVDVILRVIRGGDSVDVAKYVSSVYKNKMQKMTQLSNVDILRLRDPKSLQSPEDVRTFCKGIEKKTKILEKTVEHSTSMLRDILCILSLSRNDLQRQILVARRMNGPVSGMIS